MTEMEYVMSVLKRILAALEGIASWRWATVTSVDPLRITPDGDTSPMAEAPDTLVGGLTAGERVRLVIVARRALILGRARPDTGWKIHGGTLGPGVTQYVAVQYRIVDGIVYWRGQVYRSGGWVSGGNIVLTGVSSQARPAQKTPLTVSYDVGNLSAYMDADGTMRIYSVGGTSAAWPLISGSYPAG